MDKVSKKEFSRFVKEQRLKQGITQDDLAKRLNISSEVVSKWERGIRFPSFELVEELANALGVSVQDIFDNSKKPSKPVKINVGVFVGIIVLITATLCGVILGTKYKNKKIHSANPTTEFANAEINYGIFTCWDETDLLPTFRISLDTIQYSASAYASYLRQEAYTINGKYILFGEEQAEIISPTEIMYNGKKFVLSNVRIEKGYLIKTNSDTFVTYDKSVLKIKNIDELNIIDKMDTGSQIIFGVSVVEELYPPMGAITIIEDSAYNREMECNVTAEEFKFCLNALHELGYTIRYN